MGQDAGRPAFAKKWGIAPIDTEIMHHLIRCFGSLGEVLKCFNEIQYQKVLMQHQQNIIPVTKTVRETQNRT